MNGTVTPQHGGDDDGAVEEEEHAARQKPRSNVVKSRIVIVPFCDRNVLGGHNFDSGVESRLAG